MDPQLIDTAIEVVGWAAALLILASYLLVSAGRLSGQSPVFQWMNVMGAAGFILNSGWHGALPSAVLNIAWMAIGLVTLARLARKRPPA
ncbi:MAG: hypothetical protein H2054_00265 [Sphingomonas sp.]|nr:hypothetical protein [Sphingomonas sp.]